MIDLREQIAQAFHEATKDSLVEFQSFETGYEAGWKAARATPANQVCATCNGHGMIGGPSYSQPDEGGEPCPDCNPIAPTNDQFTTMWQDLNNAFGRPGSDRDTPLIVQFARAVWSLK